MELKSFELAGRRERAGEKRTTGLGALFESSELVGGRVAGGGGAETAGQVEGIVSIVVRESECVSVVSASNLRAFRCFCHISRVHS